MKKVLLCSVLIMAALTVQAQMGGGAEKAIADMEHQWASAIKMGNPDAIAPMLAENFIQVNRDGSMRSKPQLLGTIKGSKWEINEISDVKVIMSGNNAAIATGTWQGKGTTGTGAAIDARERWVDTWLKMPNGKWECLASASAPLKM